jgi:hypothetical protein
MRGHPLHRLPAPWRKAIYLIIAVLLFAVVVPVMFRLGLITGIGFVISCLLALYRGVLWKDAGAVLFIAAGYAITSLAVHALLPAAYANLQNQSFLVAALLVLAFIFIWWRLRALRAGKHK